MDSNDNGMCGDSSQSDATGPPCSQDIEKLLKEFYVMWSELTTINSEVENCMEVLERAGIDTTSDEAIRKEKDKILETRKTLEDELTLLYKEYAMMLHEFREGSK